MQTDDPTSATTTVDKDKPLACATRPAARHAHVHVVTVTTRIEIRDAGIGAASGLSMLAIGGSLLATQARRSGQSRATAN